MHRDGGFAGREEVGEDLVVDQGREVIDGERAMLGEGGDDLLLAFEAVGIAAFTIWRYGWCRAKLLPMSRKEVPAKWPFGILECTTGSARARAARRP